MQNRLRPITLDAHDEIGTIPSPSGGAHVNPAESTPSWRESMAAYDAESEALLSAWISHLATPADTALPGDADTAGEGLDAKTRQLVWVGSSTALRAAPSMRTHMRRAVEEGATELEVYQAMALGASSGGVPALIHGLSILHELFRKAEG
jgi:4-carboxymuconolactone decarboxylase